MDCNIYLGPVNVAIHWLFDSDASTHHAAYIESKVVDLVLYVSSCLDRSSLCRGLDKKEDSRDTLRHANVEKFVVFGIRLPMCSVHVPLLPVRDAIIVIIATDSCRVRVLLSWCYVHQLGK